MNAPPLIRGECGGRSQAHIPLIRAELLCDEPFVISLIRALFDVMKCPKPKLRAREMDRAPTASPPLYSHSPTGLS